MNAKDFLQQSHRLNDMITSNLNELDTLRDQAINVSAQQYDRDKLCSPGYVNSKIEGIVLKIMEYENKINDEIDRLIDLKEAIRCAIAGISNQDQQLLLRLHYLEYLPWIDVQKRMNLSEKQVHRLHGEALKLVKVPPICSVKDENVRV